MKNEKQQIAKINKHQQKIDNKLNAIEQKVRKPKKFRPKGNRPGYISSQNADIDKYFVNEPKYGRSIQDVIGTNQRKTLDLVREFQ
jgi:hypothetical protein